MARRAVIRPSWRPEAPLLVAVLGALTILGPLLAPGVALVYDMAWSPVPEWTPYVLGLGTPAPRVVPSDAVAVLLGKVIGPGVAQAVVLLGALVLLGWGTSRLLGHLRPGASALAGCAAAIGAQWSAVVAERLAVGQWTVLVGAAVVPFVLRAALRVRTGEGDAWGMVPGVLLACLFGANAVVTAVLPLVLVLVWPRPRWRAAAVVVASTLLCSAVWALPALVASPAVSDASVTAFRPVSDTPFGAVVSLLSGGGLWNPASHPPSRDVALVAAVSTVLVLGGVAVAFSRLRGRGGAALLGAAAACLALPVLATVPVAEPLWSFLVTEVPGGGLLRDPQKLVVTWVVVGAVGVGALVDLLAARLPVPEAGVALGVLGVLLPVALLPTMAWGLGGRLATADVPPDYVETLEVVSAAPDGVVAVLPWQQYRRYPWNGSRVSLTIVPRVVDQEVLFDDALPLSSGRIPGEDARAARVGAALEAGRDVASVLRAEGVRYVVIEESAGASPDPATLGSVLRASEHVTVVELAGSGTPADPATWPVLTGWILSSAGAVVILATWVLRRALRDRHLLLQFRA